MTQKEKRIYLIEELLKKQATKTDIKIPENEQEQKNLLRSLFNIRVPKTIGTSFLAVQDAYLQEETKQKGITDLADCCISTGEFHFSNDEAAKIAVKVVNEYKCRTKSEIEVIFNVFKDEDYEIYKELLRAD